jgi:hypothetical protein
MQEEFVNWEERIESAAPKLTAASKMAEPAHWIAGDRWKAVRPLAHWIARNRGKAISAGWGGSLS